MKLKCEKCGTEVDEEDSYKLGNEQVCEDCYFDSAMPQNPCDPVAQSSTDKFQEVFGEVKPEQLLEEQRKVYEFIKEREKVTSMEILQKFSMRQGELTQIFIVLRRFKLAKGARIDDEIYCVPWDYGISEDYDEE
jgi:transcription initiation factor IIE alpha subunit